MANAGRHAGPGASPAAVLVALFEEGGEARVVLTVRSDRLRSHQGEVAFPGGRLDPGEGMVDAALREAHEEVGLDPATGHRGRRADGHAHGLLQYPDDPGGGHPRRPGLIAASPAEVARVFDVALGDLAADGVFPEECWAVPGRRPPAGPGGEFPVWFFDVAGETVWGATARALTELLCLVLGVDVPSPADPGRAAGLTRPAASDRDLRPVAPGQPGAAVRAPSVPRGGIVGESVGALSELPHDRRTSRTATRVRRTFTWLS